MDEIESNYQAFFDGLLTAKELSQFHPILVKRLDVDPVRFARLVGRFWLHFRPYVGGKDRTCTGDEFIAMMGIYLHAKAFYGEILDD
jgi:hypothetical protein